MQTAPNIHPWPMRPATTPLNRANVAIGLSISLLLHLLLVAWTWQHRVANHRFPEPMSIVVHLVPPAAVAPPLAPRQPEPVKPEPVKPQHETATRPAQVLKPRTIAVAPVQVPHEVAPPVTVPTPAPQPEKHLDMNAIYGSVKSAVAEVDRQNAETPTGQLAAKPLYPPEPANKIGKMIDSTTRADCKDQVEGYGLFTPIAVLATLLDKKDSGCKWR